MALETQINAVTIFKQLMEAERINGNSVVKFYQFMTSVLTFTSNNANFQKYFANITDASDKQQLLRELMLMGVEQLFDNNAEYRDMINTVFGGDDTIIGTTTTMVFNLMRIVQSASTNKKRLSGIEKRAFVRNSIISYLRFTDLSDTDKQYINTAISCLIMVKNGALKLQKTCKTNGWCCY